MGIVARRTLGTAVAVAAAAGSSLGLAPTAQAATSPFVAPTSARVARGSTVVETSTLAKTSGNTSVVYSVAASGAQQTLLRLPHTEVVLAVSGNGRRIAVGAAAGKAVVTKIYDLASHRVTTLPGLVAAFTNPTGANVYVWPSKSSPISLVKTDLTGRVTARYPGISEGIVVSSPNGVLVWGSNKRHMTLSNNATGKQLRAFANPRGFAFCFPEGAWDATSAVGGCEASGAGNPQVFLFHTNGTTTPLTSRITSPTGGWIGAWHSSLGLVAQESGGCVPAPPVLQVGRRLRSIPVQGVVDVRGTTVVGLTSTGCNTTIPRLVRVDLPGMRTHTLLIPAKGRTISNAITND